MNHLTFFLLFGLFLSLGQRGYAQQIQVSRDTVELGEILPVSITNASFLAAKGDILGAWEVWENQDSLLLLQSFETGQMLLPAIPVRINGRQDSVSSDQLVTVVAPYSSGEKPAPKSIQTGLDIPTTVWDVVPYLLVMIGGLLWTILWFVASVRQYGPARKLAPPPTPATIARNTIAAVDPKATTDIQWSWLQKILRLYLSDQLLVDAGGMRLDELAALSQVADREDFQDIIRMLEAVEGKRFAGESPTTDQVAELRSKLSAFVNTTTALGEERKLKRGAEFGWRAGAVRRLLAALADLMPPALISAGLWLWPGFLHQISGEEWPLTLPWAIGAGVVVTLVIRTIVAQITEASSWQATPGMRLMKLAVVRDYSASSSRRPWRPLLWLLCSLPAGLGHLGAFGKSRKTITDHLTNTHIRRYP